MACMEHECLTCSHFWCDNQPKPRCPMCSSSMVSHMFDEREEEEEEDDDEEDYYYYDEEEDRDDETDR